MTGWDWDHVDRTMTIPRLMSLQKVWEATPPPALSLTAIAQANGMKKKGKPKPKKNAGAALELAEALKGL